jgi:hypothetical protein
MDGHQATVCNGAHLWFAAAPDSVVPFVCLRCGVHAAPCPECVNGRIEIHGRTAVHIGCSGTGKIEVSQVTPVQLAELCLLGRDRFDPPASEALCSPIPGKKWPVTDLHQPRASLGDTPG